MSTENQWSKSGLSLKMTEVKMDQFCLHWFSLLIQLYLPVLSCLHHFLFLFQLLSKPFGSPKGIMSTCLMTSHILLQEIHPFILWLQIQCLLHVRHQDGQGRRSKYTTLLEYDIIIEEVCCVFLFFNDSKMALPSNMNLNFASKEQWPN